MDAAKRPARHTHAVGRGKRMRAAVLDAAITEVIEAGYAGLTVEGVARRAGVHKTTIYRNWKDTGGLLTDALASRFAADIPIPDTGSVEGDLRVLARSLVSTMTTRAGHALLTAVLSDAGRHPRLGDIKHALFDDRFQKAEPVVTRAVERGELPAGTDPTEVLVALAAPIYFRLLFTSGPVDSATADQAARIALAAARAGALPAG